MPNLSPSVQRLMQFVLWTGIFSLAYAQSPLYTSNQNQYFLHGLAAAGYGNLQADWLANTADPTPLFSALVSLTWSLTQFPPVFYVFYALLMGVYFFSLDALIGRLFGFAPDSTERLVWRALLVLVHAAGWRFLLSHTLGVEWMYVLEDGFAGQRMLGPVFQPSSFGVFLALSLTLFMLHQPLLSVFSLVLAATFHPTYLLSAGLLTAAYLWLLGVSERRWKTALMYGSLALVLVLPAVAGAYQVFSGTSPEITAVARRIIVTYRVPHHALVEEWFNFPALLKLMMIGAALYRVRKTRLFPLLFIPSVGAGLLSLLQVATGDLALALLFPWRVSILILPVSTAILLGWLVEGLSVGPLRHRPRVDSWMRTGSYGLLLVAVSVGVLRFSLDLRRGLQAADRPIEHYVADRLAGEGNFITPIKMQDFRLVSGAPVVVDFKAIPYHPAEVLEWYHRVEQVDEFYKDPACARLEALQMNYGATHLVSPQAQDPPACSGMEQIYSDPAYRLFALR